ncbi:MAG TPA: cyclic nucleotide-binding domain-containing protein [Acidimicrobiales bacterium]|nr:cyclic nucleotide-binding domain-containing protein [Acidimicrobiales bacterium]
MPLRRKDQYLEHLAKVPLFSACSKKELQTIARATDDVEVPKGKVLVEEGKPGHEFFLIVNGNASVKRGKKEIAKLGPGQYFGELALLDRGPRSASVIAKDDMEVLVLGQREFAGVIDEVPTMAHKLLMSMAQRLREADAKAYSH